MRFKEMLAHLVHPRRSNNHRPRLLHPEGIVAVCLLIAGFGVSLLFVEQAQTQLGSILGYASDISVGDVVAQTNQERAKSGLGQLTLNGQLSAAAQAKAQDMFTQQYWSHTSPSGTEPWDFIAGAGYAYRVAGENLARDFSTTPEMVAAWMASPTHKANILHPRYQEIGIAVVNGTLEGIETTLVVQMFGTPRSAQVAQVPVVTETAQAQTSQPTATPQPSPTTTPRPSPSHSPTSETAPPPPVTDHSTVDTDATAELISLQSENEPSVLAQILVPVGTIEPQLLYSPLAIAKAFGLAVVLMMITVLVYDLYVTHHRKTVRLVGKNFAHIMYLLVVAFLILYFKGGLVG